MSGTDDVGPTRSLEAAREAVDAFELAAGKPTATSLLSTGRALSAVGDVLRRCPSEQEPPGVTAALDLLLQRLPEPCLRAWCAAIDLSVVEVRLRGAADEAMFGALPDPDEDPATWLAWAKDGLLERDRLESQSVALRRAAVVGPQVSPELAQELEEKLRSVDRGLRALARSWVSLNPWRRTQRELLLPEYRDAAWWFGDRASCDELLAMLAGQAAGGAHLKTCADCRRDLAAIGTLEAPFARHLTQDDLWNMDLGLVAPHQRTVMERHARECPPCAQALAALEEGEDAIGAAAVAAPVEHPPDARVRAPTGEAPEILGEHADFRVLLFRRSARARLLVEPRRQGGLAAARLSLPEAPHRPLVFRPGPHGFELELTEAFRPGGGANLRVTMTRGGDDIQLEVRLSSPLSGL